MKVFLPFKEDKRNVNYDYINSHHPSNIANLYYDLFKQLINE